VFRGVLHAHVHTTSPDVEAEFNAWYDNIHLIEIMSKFPQISRAERFRIAPDQPPGSGALPLHRYLTVYEIEVPDVQRFAADLVAALEDGTLTPSDTIDFSECAPSLVFYEQCGPIA